jgi:hypothetical protein
MGPRRALIPALAALVLAIVSAAGCDSGSSCLPAIAGAAACPASTIVDTSVNDPICLSAGGLPLCRGSEAANCFVCSGSDFTDNCLIRSPQQTIECVHGCDKC